MATPNAETSMTNISRATATTTKENTANKEERDQRESTSSSSEAIRNEPLECLLCTEVLPRHHKKRCCCSQACCQACLYRHITTIWEDSLTGGHRPLNCPAGCGHPLSDAEIRDCLHRHHCPHWDTFWELWGHFWYFLALVVGLFLGISWTRTELGSLQSCRHYRMWRQLLHTPQELQDLDRYEQWSVSTGLRTLGSEDVLVQRCPAPNCDYAWIVADLEHRRSKQAHERRRVLLWYAPPASVSQANDWVEPDFLHFGLNAPPPPSDWDNPSSRSDGRRMVCAKCHYVFCGLCRQPWRFAGQGHARRSCRAYARNLPAAEEQLGNLGAIGEGARLCPGCHTITSRISGCNHMTCPCGRQWCYACGANWTAWHYGCVQRDQQNPDACVIL